MSTTTAKYIAQPSAATFLITPIEIYSAFYSEGVPFSFFKANDTAHSTKINIIAMEVIE